MHVQDKSGDDDVTKRKCRKKSSSINQILSVAVVNSLWSILTGEKISHADIRVKKSNENFIIIFEKLYSAQLNVLLFMFSVSNRTKRETSNIKL